MELALKMGSKKFEDKVLRIERSVKKDKKKEDKVSFIVHKFFPTGLLLHSLNALFMFSFLLFILLLSSSLLLSLIIIDRNY